MSGRSMRVDELQTLLDEPSTAAAWLRKLGIVDPRRAHENLVRIARSGITLDLVAAMCDQLAEHLPRSSDADMALNNLDRFVAAARNPIASRFASSTSTGRSATEAARRTWSRRAATSRPSSAPWGNQAPRSWCRAATVFSTMAESRAAAPPWAWPSATCLPSK